MRRRKAKPAPTKKYDLITAETAEGKEVFALLDRVRKEHKEDLKPARISAAWMIGKKPDKDGRIVLGKLKKCSELEKQIHALDAIVILNQSYWRSFSEKQRLALMHHELCHLAEALDTDGEVAYDGHGRRRWRLVKHDIEEFREVAAKHGCYKADLQNFAEALARKDPNLGLFVESEEKPIGTDVMAPLPPPPPEPPAGDANRKLISMPSRKSGRAKAGRAAVG